VSKLERTTGVQAKADSANGIHLKGKVIINPVLALQAQDKGVYDAAIRGRLAAQLAMQIGTSDLVKPTLDGYEVDVLVHTEAGWKAALERARHGLLAALSQIADMDGATAEQSAADTARTAVEVRP